jgi:hypothetical protein
MFSVNLKLYFVIFNDIENIFQVYLDDSGNIPEIKLDRTGEIEENILAKTLDFFYGDNTSLLNGCKLSSVEKNKDKLSLVYNIYCYENLNCKTGKFVNFNKNSIELYRFAQTRGYNG